MNRARRRGIENEQKGPSCLDRNAKIIGRALSTGLQETMTGGQGMGEGGPRMSPHPSIVLVLLKDTVQRYHDTVEDVISRKNRLAGFSTKVLVSFKRFLETTRSIGKPRRGFFGYWGEISANLLT